MPIKKGDKVKLDYTGTFEDGTVFDSSKHGDHSHPLEFTVGNGMVIKGFDEAVTGLEKDAEKEFTVQPEDGYGQRNEQMIGKVPRDKIPQPPEGKEIVPGMMMVVAQENGQQMPATITEVTDTEVTIDLNHPLAGKVLKFKIKVIDYSEDTGSSEDSHSEHNCEDCSDKSCDCSDKDHDCECSDDDHECKHDCEHDHSEDETKSDETSEEPTEKKEE